MASAQKKSSSFLESITDIPPRSISDDDLKVNFEVTVRKLLNEPRSRLYNLPLLLRPSENYQPTSEEKLTEFMNSEFDAYVYSVDKIKLNYFELKDYYAERMVVKDLLTKNLEIYVSTTDQIRKVECEFWKRVAESGDLKPEAEAAVLDEDEIPLAQRRRKKFKQTKKDKTPVPPQKGNGKDPRKIIARYGSDHEGSLYDHKSSEFNMLNFPNILPAVIHRFMEPIPGVTTPMLYVGEKFAFFLVHVEDKELWSINYLHKGNPKIWYVLEVQDARKFEEAVRNDLSAFICNFCKNCPCVLRHKSVLIHPEAIAKHGYKVRRIVQQEGDIVLIPPRCYHFGFNTDENVAEALNFTLPESLDYSYTSITCPEKEKEHPTLGIEWFVCSQMPEKYADYVSGNLQVIDPVSDDLIPVLPPDIKLMDSNNLTLVVGGFWELLMAKRENETEYVYINSPAGFGWLTRQVAEGMSWITPSGPKPVVFPNEIFTMTPTVLRNMDTISYFLKKGMPEALTHLYEDNRAVSTDNDDRLLEASIDDDGQGSTMVEETEVSQLDDVVKGSPMDDDGQGSTMVEETEVSPLDDVVEGSAMVEDGQGSTLEDLHADKHVEDEGSEEIQEKDRCTMGKRRGEKENEEHVEEYYVYKRVKKWTPKHKKCGTCGKLASSVKGASEWSRHQRTCNGSNKVLCEICGKKFRKDYLKIHNKVHNELQHAN